MLDRIMISLVILSLAAVVPELISILIWGE